MRTAGNMKIPAIFVLIMIFFIQPAFAQQTWQSTLAGRFDIVETFDQLQDWSGGTGYHCDAGTMPKKADGSPSIWTYYTNDVPAVDNWIKDHGPDFNWQGTGKSLCINYNNFVGGIAGYGPSRLGTFFGHGNPRDGYKKMYLFMMVKFHPGFFAMSGSTFNWVGTLKFIDFLIGFTAADIWGTPSERAQVCDTGYNFHEYGLQGAIANLYGGGSTYPTDLFLRQYAWRSTLQGSCYSNPNFMNDFSLTSASSPATYTQAYLNNEWFGIEFAVDVGTLGNADASFEVFIYDKQGNQIGHFKNSNYNQLVTFDHRLNRITIGGNRFGEGYQQDPGDSDENRFYVDDAIIHGQRIGPTYFSLLNGQTPSNHPSGPKNLRTR